jgi:hypothetical protein
MSQFIDGSLKSFTAGAAIGKHILVKLSSGKLAVAGSTEEPIGSLENESFADGDERAVRLRSCAGTMLCVAAGAIAEGAVVYCKANGKVDDVVDTDKRVGIALEAVTAANDLIEVMPC